MPFLRGALLKNKKPAETEEEILQPVNSAPVPNIPDNLDEILEESENLANVTESTPEEAAEENISETENKTESENTIEAQENQSEEKQLLSENSLPEEIPQGSNSETEIEAQEEKAEPVNVDVQIEESPAEIIESKESENPENLKEETENTDESKESEEENQDTISETNSENTGSDFESETENQTQEEDTAPVEVNEENAPEQENSDEEKPKKDEKKSEEVELKYDFTSEERYVDKVSTKTEFDKMLDELANISKDLLSWQVEKFAKKYTGKFQGEGEVEKSEADARKYEAFLGGYITNAAMTLYDNGYRDAAIKQLEQAKNILTARQKLEVETEAIKERVVEENAAVDLSDILGMFGDG